MKHLHHLILAVLSCMAPLAASAGIHDDVIFDGTPANAALGKFPDKVWRMSDDREFEEGITPCIANVEGRKALLKFESDANLLPCVYGQGGQLVENYLPEAFTIEWDTYIEKPDENSLNIWIQLDLVNGDEAYADMDNVVASLQINSAPYQNRTRTELAWFDTAEEFQDLADFDYVYEGNDASMDPCKPNAWNHYVVQYRDGVLLHTLNGVIVAEKHHVAPAKSIALHLGGYFEKTAVANFVIRKGAK